MRLFEKIEGAVREIELFIQYGVQESEQQSALLLLQRYKDDVLAMQLMKSFYASLPDPHEEAIGKIFFIHKKDDIFLMGISTARHGYLYLATDQKALLLGEFGQDMIEPEAFTFFGYLSAQDFFEKYPAFMGCEEYEPVGAAGSKFCPVCSAAEGEYHLLGCPVEICPWCDGQLSRCACRFAQLGVDVLEDEKELEELESLLKEKGRIPYAKEQRPSYPLDIDE